MRRKVYVETTVVSYLAARPSRDLLVAGHQEATRELWPLLVTWNFAHLSNPITRVRVRQLVQDEGLACPEICSPEELLESES